jgi:protein disulfide-isomerase
MKIEIWSDIMCPFCYIGKRNLESALSQFAHHEQIEVEWKSFQLDPSIPEVPTHQDDVYMFLAERKGISIEQSKKMHQDVVRYANSVGLDFQFDKTRATNSFKGHRIIQFAKTKGLGDMAKECFFKAYFTEGKNLNDPATLMELSNEIGLTEAEFKEALTNPIYAQKVDEDTNKAVALGVRGVPFFVLNRKYAIAGAQASTEMLKAIEHAFTEWKQEQAQSLIIQDGHYCEPEGDCR